MYIVCVHVNVYCMCASYDDVETFEACNDA